MKKFLLLLLVMAVCLSALSGCSEFDNESSGSATENIHKDLLPNAPPEDVEFSKFLDTENFVPGVSQGEFMKHMAKYSQEGTPITDIVEGCHYDTYFGGGYKAQSEFFGFVNDYTAENSIADYYNRMWTKVQLDGLNLPFEITFEDSLTDVFKKVELTTNPYDDFTADKNSDTNMTLFNENNASLIFKDLNRSSTPVGNEMPYVLLYSETYNTQRKDGRQATVNRTVILSFGHTQKLEMLEMKVTENFKIK